MKAHPVSQKEIKHYPFTTCYMPLGLVCAMLKGSASAKPWDHTFEPQLERALFRKCITQEAILGKSFLVGKFHTGTHKTVDFCVPGICLVF